MAKYEENVGPAQVLTLQNAALLLIDHQVGLMQLVRDMTPEEFKNNVMGLAKTAKHFGIPVTTGRCAWMALCNGFPRASAGLGSPARYRHGL